MFIVLLQKKT